MTKAKTNREYKDKLFRKIFSNKEELLELYNALNESEYTMEDDLTINTLEDGVFISHKNDASFILGGDVSLYEHQSTVCGNMPLRFLVYISGIYSDYVKEMNLYGTPRIDLPNPKFIVFYNGNMNIPERSEKRLSESFVGEPDPNLELVVTVLNINKGYNAALMEKCQKLNEYASFVEKVKEYRKQGIKDLSIIRTVVDDCINAGILREYLMKNRAEVENMSIWEYDGEKQLAMERAEGRAVGRAEGIAVGRAEGIKLMVETYADISESLEEAIAKTAQKYNMSVDEIQEIMADKMVR